MNVAKILFQVTLAMIFITYSLGFYPELYTINFSVFDQKFFLKKVNKSGNALQSRITAVINRVLIFRALKSRQVKIFSYSV